MASIVSVKSYYTRQIKSDTITKSGSNDITTAYLNNSGGNPIVEDVSSLNNKTKITAVSQMVGDLKILVTIEKDLDEAITYDRIYLTNSNNQVLNVVDIEQKSNVKQINESFIIQLSEINSIIS
jgi:hypothetical protein